MANSIETKKTQTIDDVTQYSNISVKELKELMGEPVLKDNWTNKTSKGNFKFTTFEYDKDTRHYEFIIYKKKVVRVTIYSGDYWTNDGNKFQYDGNVNSIFDMFNVVPDETARKKDTGFAYVLTPVNDKIAKFHIQNIKKQTFGLVKVTYNLNYFD